MTTFQGYNLIATTNVEGNRIIEANGDSDEELVLLFLTSRSGKGKGFRMKWKVQTDTTIAPKILSSQRFYDLQNMHH